MTTSERPPRATAETFGGGVSSAWDAFAPAMFAEVRRRSFVYAGTTAEDGGGLGGRAAGNATLPAAGAEAGNAPLPAAGAVADNAPLPAPGAGGLTQIVRAVVYEIERQSSSACGAPSGTDMALLRIARLHQGN